MPSQIGHDLRVVGDGAEHQLRVIARSPPYSSGMPASAWPISSYRTSVVGAITDPARASRNERSHGERRAQRGAAAGLHGLRRDPDRHLVRDRLRRQHRRGRVALAHPAGEIRQEPAERVDLGLRASDARAHRRQLGERLPQVLELRAGDVRDRRPTAPSAMPERHARPIPAGTTAARRRASGRDPCPPRRAASASATGVSNVIGALALPRSPRPSHGGPTSMPAASPPHQVEAGLRAARPPPRAGSRRRTSSAWPALVTNDFCGADPSRPRSG